MYSIISIFVGNATVSKQTWFSKLIQGIHPDKMNWVGMYFRYGNVTSAQTYSDPAYNLELEAWDQYHSSLTHEWCTHSARNLFHANTSSTSLYFRTIKQNILLFATIIYILLLELKSYFLNTDQ